MKKPKIDLDKIIRVKPKMVKEGPDVGLLFVMILGFLLGMVLISLTSCDEQPKSKEEPIGLRQKSDEHYKNVTEYTYGGCEHFVLTIHQHMVLCLKTPIRIDMQPLLQHLGLT